MEEIGSKIDIIVKRIIENIRIYGPRMTVTQRAKSVKQPYGGYVRRIDFEEVLFSKGASVLHDNENVNPGTVGASVDYLTRFMLSGNVIESFKISILGSIKKDEGKLSKRLIKSIKGLDDKSIKNAIKMAGFDVIYRNGGFGYIPVREIKPDINTIENVRVMVERTMSFFKEYGPIILEGFDFEGGYTKVIASGDGDYITKDTLWDLKTLKNHFNKNHIMQLLIYWRMGLRSDYHNFKSIKYIGIFNPRLNKGFRYDLSNLDNKTIKIIDEEIIGYQTCLITKKK